MLQHDLKVSILFGPDVIEEGSPQFLAAVAKVDKALKWVGEFVEIQSQSTIGATIDDWLIQNPCPIDANYDDYDSIEDVVKVLIASLSRVFDIHVPLITGLDFFQEFMEFWNCGTEDSSERYDPKGSIRRKTVVVGGSDEAYLTGTGYNLLTAADIMVILPELDIE